MNETKHPTSLPSPATATTLLNMALAENAIEHSRVSPRLRILQRIHKEDSDPYHRMLNAMQPGSYFRPHRHLDPPKSETLVVLRGAMRVVIFHDNGEIDEHHELSPAGDIFGIDFLPHVYHTLIVLEPDTLMFESKTGPYTQSTDKDFAPWSPAENSIKVKTYLNELILKTGGI